MSRTLTRYWSSTNGTNVEECRKDFTGELVSEIDVSVADSSTDFEIVVAVDVSEIKSFFLKSDQAVTVETNSGSTPTDTFTLAANSPLAWENTSPIATPFSGDITALYITNSSGSAAAIKGHVLVDATP